MWRKIFTATRIKKRSVKGLNNQDGQIAIFIALIFQVLFIFFAMLINVGLIVHDKINLQNSVDLAAYYGAERQAELLDEIAHINYQIRQENKLLAWRQRILGTYTYPGNSRFLAVPQDSVAEITPPAVCVDHSGWLEVRNSDPDPDPTHAIDYCKTLNFQNPPVPTFTVIAGFVGINTALQGYFQRVANTVIDGCKAFGPLNWYTASLWLYEYKQSVRYRSEMIRALATNLSLPAKTMLDIRGRLIADGVRKTFLRNLTEANRVSVSSKANDQIDNASDFVFINGLGSDVSGCGSPGIGDTPNWLHENRINPQISYANSVTGGAGQCNGFQDLVSHTPTQGMARYQALGPTFAALVAMDAGEPAAGTHSMPYSSAGFEKNPWCLAYFGIKATTRPRKPFAPFGKPVALLARAFASPFGGRIGPWTHSQWASGTPSSSGGTLVDPLLVPRDGGTAPNPANLDGIIPNYSRYPGDRLGLKSQLEHYLYSRSLLGEALPPTGVLKLASYEHLTNPAKSHGTHQHELRLARGAGLGA